MPAKDVSERHKNFFPKDTIIFREGDPGDHMYILLTGEVRIVKNIRGAEVVLAIMEKGDFFGEMALLENASRSATAIVNKDAEVIVIDKDNFQPMFSKNPEIAIKMLIKFSGRLRETNNKIDALLLRDDASRVVGALLKLSDDYGVEEPHGVRINYPVTYEHLANVSALKTAEVKTIVERLVNAGMISIANMDFIVESREHLRQFYDYLTWRQR
ncbi:MAG: Crp/Fnr family transcriptional regulator [Nitrospirae bacterium]|nr:Crp/Fnr family transcriptional regulator [Nitrospirota bacterium]